MSFIDLENIMLPFESKRETVILCDVSNKTGLHHWLTHTIVILSSVPTNNHSSTDKTHEREVVLQWSLNAGQLQSEEMCL